MTWNGDDTEVAQDEIGCLIESRPDRCAESQETVGWKEGATLDTMKRQIEGWAYGPMTESACCFPEGSVQSLSIQVRFSQLPVTTASGDLRPSSAL